MHQKRIDDLDKRLQDMQSSTLSMQQQQQEKFDSKLAEIKKEINEDLIKPLSGKIDKFEQLMMTNNQLLTQLQGAGGLAANATTAPMNNTGATRPVNPYQMNAHRGFGRPRWQPSMPGGKGAGGGKGAKRPLICFNCGEEGHPFRLCPRLTVAACMEVADANANWDMGGNTVCTVDAIRNSFDADGSLGNDEMICALCTSWVDAKVQKLYDNGTVDLAQPPVQSANSTITFTEEHEHSLHVQKQSEELPDETIRNTHGACTVANRYSQYTITDTVSQYSNAGS